MSRENTLSGLLQDVEVRETLKRIVEFEEKQEKKFKEDPIYQGLNPKPCWELTDIPAEWHVVKKLLFAGVVVKEAKKWYVLKDRNSVKKALEEYEKLTEECEIPKEASEEIPKDLFDIIEGFDDLKWWFKKAISAKKVVHTLLVGPPGVAKSLFLLECSRIPGSIFITAGTSRKAGIRDLLMERRPKILLIDEIEKIENPLDLSVLLTMMESQRVIDVRHNVHVDVEVPCRVFAACNSTDRLPKELLDRFRIFHIKPYTPEQAYRILVKYLTVREGVNEDLAKYIAEKVVKYTTSVREGIRLARICESKEDVDKALELFKKYGGGLNE